MVKMTAEELAGAMGVSRDAARYLVTFLTKTKMIANAGVKRKEGVKTGVGANLYEFDPIDVGRRLAQMFEKVN